MEPKVQTVSWNNKKLAPMWLYIEANHLNVDMAQQWLNKLIVDVHYWSANYEMIKHYAPKKAVAHALHNRNKCQEWLDELIRFNELECLELEGLEASAVEDVTNG